MGQGRSKRDVTRREAIASLVVALRAPQAVAAPPRTPTWYRSATAGQWCELPNSTLATSGVGWTGTHPGGTFKYEAIVIAWGGGVLNTVGLWRGGRFVRGTFLVIFGGGHSDYGGNELYAYGPLESDAPSWSRLTDPTIPAPDDVARSRGAPVSRHTYDTLVYLPTLNKMLCIGAPGYYRIGFAFNVSDLFDFNVDPSSASPWSTNDVGFPAYDGGDFRTIALISGYDRTTGKAWGLGAGRGQRLGVFDAASLTWSDYAKDNPYFGSAGPYTKGAIDAARNLFVFIQQTTGAVVVQNLASPTSPLYTPTVTGSGPGIGNSVLEWDAAGRCFVSWARSGRTLYFLTPGANPASGGDAWTWTSTAPKAGATPADSTPNGTFGRFRVNDGPLHGVVVMPTQRDPICFYKF
jgi:hypothetical protein